MLLEGVDGVVEDEVEQGGVDVVRLGEPEPVVAPGGQGLTRGPRLSRVTKIPGYLGFPGVSRIP